MNHHDEIKCIFFSEFHPKVGPMISYQAPENYMKKDVFDLVQVYIITKPQLQHSIITVNTSQLKLVGCPVCIENSKYPRNELIFNLCFVFDAETNTLCYEAVIKKLAGYLMNLELESNFLSNEETRQTFPDILNKILHKLNWLGTCSIHINDSTTIYLKIVPHSKTPLLIEGHNVPIIDPDSKSLMAARSWELATEQLLPYIDGIRHVAQIAAEADVDIEIVEACIQNLAYYGVIKLIPIFQYSNVYRTRAAIKKLEEDHNMRRECINYVAKPGKSPRFRDIFLMYCGLTAGTTVRDLCMRHNPHSVGVDERKLIQYGLMKGLIQRLHKYPVKLPNEPGSSKLKHLYRWFNGCHSYDEICCQKGLSYQELDEKVENDPSIVVCWK